MSTMSKAGSMDSVRWALRSKIFLVALALAVGVSLLVLAAPSKAQTASEPSFGTSSLGGESSSNPTSLQFGPDGRLYVAQQDGTIKAYTVERNAKNDYSVTSTETINNIKNIQNHNDDGTIGSTTPTGKRQITGILVKGTASQPVIYVTSSDPRIGAGTSKGDVNLDTNSGVISKLTKSSTGWSKVDLVRGLPRSEENHSLNGLQLKNNTLYVTVGGHTNQGAPSNNFALLPEYALSAAIISVDLGTIGNTTYDLPTIGTSPNQPFGGKDGNNQAKLVSGGPIQVYSPGYRNAYDLVIAESGKMYTIDNGGNGGWGEVPKGVNTPSCTNAPNEPGETNQDNFHHVSGEGYYGGHPNPTRGNPSGSGFSGAVPSANSIECNYDKPADGTLTTFPASTNGITEYTASNFGGVWKGDLLTAAFNETIYRIELNDSGTQMAAKSAEFSNFGANPLDVTAQGDNDPFPGTVWAAVYGAGSVQVFEPEDFGGGGTTTCDASAPNGDADGDGFTNSDEQSNGTDPCSAASQPADADGDGVSNKTDPDDDNDGQGDQVDPFALDPKNGLTTDLPKSLTFENETGGTSPGGILDLGFTGLMTNGTSDYEALYDPENVIPGGAAGVLTVEGVTAGDAYKANNTQEYGFQFGANTAGETQPFTANTQISGPFAGITPENYQSMGMYIGTGDQDNYLKIVTTANGGNGGIEVLQEVGGTPSGKKYGPSVGVDILGSDSVDLYLTVDPATSTAQPSYSINGGTQKNLGSPVAIPQSWLGPKALAVGVISTSNGPGPEFPATWKFLQITSGGTPSEPTEPTPTEPENVVHRVNAGGAALSGSTPPWSPDTKANPSPYVNAIETGNKTFSTTEQVDTSEVPGYVPMKLFQSERWDPAVAPEMKWDFPVEPGQYEVRLYFAETYSGTAANDARLFDVDVEVEGNTVLNDYDVYENAGNEANKAVMEPISVTVEDNNLDINFLHVKENPNVKGIEILKTGDVAASPDPAGEWKTLAPSSQNRQEVAYVKAGGKFYLTGGGTLHEAYNPKTNSWSTVKSLPANLDHIQGVELGGKIYYIGGLSNFPGPHVNTVYVYDPATNTFAQGAQMPTDRGRGAGGVAAHNGKIYYAGGLHEGKAVSWFDVYDPATDSWKQLPNMPRVRDHFQAAVVGGKFYAIGGRDTAINATTPANDAYNFATGSWDTGGAPLPTPRGGFASAVLGKEILIIGGEGGGKTYAEVEAYNTTTDSWRTLAPMPTARHGIQAAECNGGVYVAAGGTKQGGGAPTNKHEAFFLNGVTTCEPSPASDQNTAPQAIVDEYNVDQDSVLAVDAPGVLGNDTDADQGTALTAKLGQDAGNGTLKLNADGSFTYTPNAGFTGTDTFTYKANDGQADSQATTVTINVNKSQPTEPAPTEPNPDTVAPSTTLTGGPKGFTRSRAARFEFESSEPGSSFQCKLDSNPFTSCSSPEVYRGLSDGRHVFRVRATDEAGNTDGSAAGRVWRVDTKGPAVDRISPKNRTRDRTPTVRATVKDEQVNLAKRDIKLYFDGKRKGKFSYNRRTDRLSYNTGRIAKKRHSVRIVAVDRAGNRTVKVWRFRVV